MVAKVILGDLAPKVEIPFGGQSMTAPLKAVMIRHPDRTLCEARAEEWHYGPGFNGRHALHQYAAFAELLEESGARLLSLGDDDDGLADAMFTHDPSLVTNQGAILLRMGKELRSDEPALHRAFYQRFGIPLLGEIEAPGQVEGGDCIWVDEATLAVGRGVRSNEAGIRQLQAILAPHGVSVHGFDLPLYKGFAACLHLMSIMSPLAEKLALVYPPLFPVAFWQLLLERGYQLLEAPEDEFEASNGLSLNVLATRPYEVIAIKGCRKTKRLMEKAGCTVRTFKADALCIACEGGPTCLTRPILRGEP